jgi:2-dehydro-3-deoxy-D-arabinonate dehydratase
MKRSHAELASFLCRSMDFEQGVYLMTGTCLVPSHDFTLAEGDQVNISIQHIGTLINTVGIK